MSRLFAIATTAALAACSPSEPQLCAMCPDVSGGYQLTRTVTSAASCPDPPSGGQVLVNVTQNGSHLDVRYDGQILKGDLFADDSAKVAAQWTKSDSTGTWNVSASMNGSFTAEGATMKLTAKVSETRTPADATTNHGNTCDITATLVGAR